MIISQDGREILADALRAVANVLDRHRQQAGTKAGGQQGLDAASRPAEPASAAGIDRGADAVIDTQLPLTAAGEQADAMTGPQPESFDAEGGTGG
jgi:hypothetical protein